MIAVDVFNLIYRALGVVTGKRMRSEGYLYGDIGKSFLQVFFKMFNRIYRNFRNEEIVIAWEGDGRNFRYGIYPDYKGNRDGKMREEIDDDYYAAVREGLACYGCKILQHEKAEADDIIYGLCDLFRDKEITVISGDSDFIQLLQQFDNVKLFSPNKDSYLAKPKYDYVKYKAIRGDASDNIKGLYGYGEKKAAAVLGNYETFWGALSEESQEMILRNVTIIDLSRNPDNDEIRQSIKKQISEQKNEFSLKRISQFTIRYQLKEIYANLNSELGAFHK